MRKKNLFPTRILLWTATAILLLSYLACARLGKPRTISVEGGNVKAWVVTPQAIPTFGPLARARPGDIALSDGEITIVVSQAVHGGRWIDAALAADDNYDYLGWTAPVYDNRLDSAYKVETVEIVRDGPDARPAVLVRGEDRDRPGLAIETRYEIIPASHTVVLTTRLRNATTQTLDALWPGDRIQWGTDDVFVPYVGNIRRPTRGAVTAEWLCAWQDDFCMGITPAEGSLRVEFDKKGATLFYGGRARLAPGEDLSYRRYFPLRKRQIAAVSEFAWKLRGKPLGWLEGEVHETVSDRPVPDCRVEVLSSPRNPGSPGTRSLTWVYTNDKGRFRVALPAGRFFVWTHRAVGRRGESIGISYDIAAGKTTRTRRPLQVSPKVLLHFEVTDADTGEPLPCKLIFQSFPGQPTVDFGPEWHGPGARNVYYSATGKGKVNISAGRYRVYVSRGPEYEMAVRDIKVAYSQNNRFEARLKRVIRMDDFISVDLGVRTSRSPGCKVTPRDRVVAAAAEGLQCIVSGDVGIATDLAPAVREAGLSKWLKTICGRRIEWRTPKGRGDFLVFPCPPGRPSPSQLRRESAARSPARLIRAIRRSCPDGLIAVCDPMESVHGYLATQGFTITPEPLPTLPRRALGFDLYAMARNGGPALLADHRMYTRLLREIARYGLGAASDSRYLRGNECGYPRVYVARSPDAGSSITDQVRKGLLEGRVLVTNGPFIKLLVNGKPPGSFVTDTDGTLDILVEVRAPKWVDVRAVTIYDGEFFRRNTLMPPSNQTLRFPRTATASPEFKLKIKHDVIITATAAGQRSLAPVVAQDEARGFQAYPYAMTGPIFVDADGDGKCTPPSPYKELRETEEF